MMAVSRSLPPRYAHLAMALRTALPGVDAYRAISGQSRRPVRARRDAREGAVLICLVDEEDRVRFPLIERAPDPGPHSGQIALPGGSAEAFDTDHAATALREAEEEIGLPAREVTVVGSLTPLYIPRQQLSHPSDRGLVRGNTRAGVAFGAATRGSGCDSDG